MSLFKNPEVVIWPKSKVVEIYRDKADDNIFSFEIDLWKELDDDEISRLNQFLKSNNFTKATILISDDIVFTRTFIYDSPITTAKPEDIITLASPFVDFKIDEHSVTFEIIQSGPKTQLLARIFNQPILLPLLNNLNRLDIKLEYSAISESIAKIISKFYPNPCFVFYPLEDGTEYIAILCYQSKVYLTSIVKKTLTDIKKTINYSQAYFGEIAKKVYLPESIIENFDLSNIEKIAYTDSKLSQDLSLPSNLPLPVAGIISQVKNKNLQKPMENKKSILPIVAVFLFTALIAAFIVWFVLSRDNNSTDINNPETDLITPIEQVSPIPSPSPAIIKPITTIKLQVLNATDISGQAATIKEQLVKLGFDSVNVGNSVEKLTENEIRLKPALATSSAYFKSQIPSFADAKVTELKTTSTYDVVFIIGTNLSTGQAATIAPSVTPAL